MPEYEELIPDFDEMQEMIEEAGRLQANVMVLKDIIKAFIANCIKETLENKDLWVGPKQPSMAYCDKVIAQIGNTTSDKTTLEELRADLAQAIERLETLSGLIQLNRDKLDLFRTFSANTRKVHY